MIHELIKLDRPIFCVDAETTGVDANADRIIEFAYQEWGSQGFVREWSCRFNPGKPVGKSFGAHGISDETLAECPPFSLYAADLAGILSDCDFLGKNVRFDLSILGHEFHRHGVEWSYKMARIVDADRLEQLGEPRGLSDLYSKHIRVTCPHCHGARGFGPNNYEKCQECSGNGWVPAELSGAHGALADVRATTLVIMAQLQKYATLPRDIAALHELQFPGRIDTEGKFRFVDGVPTCFFGKYRNKPMTVIDEWYWKEFILSPKKDFPEEIKALARDALRGVFPVQKAQDGE